MLAYEIIKNITAYLKIKYNLILIFPSILMNGVNSNYKLDSFIKTCLDNISY